MNNYSMITYTCLMKFGLSPKRIKDLFGDPDRTYFHPFYRKNVKLYALKRVQNILRSLKL
jgi:hypothetical protein